MLQNKEVNKIRIKTNFGWAFILLLLVSGEPPTSTITPPSLVDGGLIKHNTDNIKEFIYQITKDNQGWSNKEYSEGTYNSKGISLCGSTYKKHDLSENTIRLNTFGGST